MKPSINQRAARHSTIQVMIGAALISFSPVLVRVADVGPTMAGFYRCLFGGLALAVIVLIRGDPLFTGRRSLLLALFASVLFATDLSLWHRAIGYVGPGLATILANFEVFFLAAFGILVLKEKVDWRFLVSVPLAVAGLFLVVGLDWNQLAPDYRWGIYLGLLGAIAYSGYMIVLRKSQHLRPPISTVSHLMIVSLAVAAIMGVEGTLQGETFWIPDTRSLIAMLVYGVLCQALAWVLISRGLGGMDASRAGLLLLLQPTLAFIWDIVLFARQTGMTDALGAALALGAIYLGTTTRGSHAE